MDPMIGGIVGQALGMVTDGISQNRQYEYQRKLNNEQVAANKQIALLNHELGMQMWRDTNYSAQRRELEKAGLNPGLMYSKGGPGGSTQGAGQSGPANAGAAGMINTSGMGMIAGIQAAQAQAQVENIKANTENTKADTEVKKAQPGVMEAGRQKTLAEISNEVLKGTSIELQNKLSDIERRINENTIFDAIGQVQEAYNKARGEAQSAQAKGQVDEATKDEAIQIMQQNVTEQSVRIAAQKMGMKVDATHIQQMTATITKTMADNQREWENMSYKDREIQIRQKANEIAQQFADFNTGGEAQVQRWAGVISTILGAGTGMAHTIPKK